MFVKCRTFARYFQINPIFHATMPCANYWTPHSISRLARSSSVFFSFFLRDPGFLVLLLACEFKNSKCKGFSDFCTIDTIFHIPGSPYHPLIVDPVNVRVSGGWRPYLDEKGLIPLKVNKEKHLPFDVSQAGPGEKHREDIYQ